MLREPADVDAAYPRPGGQLAAPAREGETDDQSQRDGTTGTEGYERRRRERTLSRAAPRCEEGRFGVHGSANSRRGRAPAT